MRQDNKYKELIFVEMKNHFQVAEPAPELIQRAQLTRSAALELGQTSDEKRRNALFSMADALHDFSKEIHQANLQDIKTAEREGLSASLLARLKLDELKLQAAIKGVRKVAELSDPLGIRQLYRELDNELLLERI